MMMTDSGRGFMLKSWDVTVHGYGTERVVAASRGKALARAWRCDAFNRLTFGDFLKIATAWKALLVPADFGEPILVQGRPAFKVGQRCSYTAFVWPFTETVLNAHPSDVAPATEATTTQKGSDNA
jgi:hypothetical protein